MREFETALDGEVADLETAVDLYRGDFLDGFYVRGSPEFEAWLLAKRHQLRERLLAALKRLAEYEAGRGEFRPATGHAQRLLALEPLREDVHRLLMTVFARSGQRARALAQYEACAQILAQELEVEPGEETKRLFRQIRDGSFAPLLSTTEKVVSPRYNLPAPMTSFVGREAELAQLKTWLGNENGRLLTIVGPGGIGKTRLALHAARSVLDKFAHGTWFVTLTSLANVENVPTAVASTLGITFFGKAGPETQVVNYLRRRELLLVFDNAEHLISQSLVDFLATLLSQAAGVKMVITSRQRLMMQAEKVLNLSGLAYPEAETPVAAFAYPAGTLFLERSRNHGTQLGASPQVDTAVQRLCRAVDGLPLALELAAAWTSTLPLSTINAEIERGIEFLTTTMRDVSPRHRSIRAVFDTSWQLLDKGERRLMRRLAYFRGGFSDDAAAAVAGATPVQLKALGHKSLIRYLDNGRYDMHELIRQYAVRKLVHQESEEKDVARQHGRYFSGFLAERKDIIQGRGYLQAKAEIEAEIDNVRQAWEWAVAAHSLEDIACSAEALHYYFLNTQGLFSEAAQRFQDAAAQIEALADEQAHPLVGRLLLKAAVNQRMLGQFADARQLAQQSLAIFYQQELSSEAQARKLDDPIDLCLCLNNLAYVLAHNGDYNSAIGVAKESAALARSIACPHGALSAMNMLGVYYQQIGDTEKAEAVLGELVDRCCETATRSRLAQAVNNLGSLYKKRGEWGKALPLLREALKLYEAVGQTHYAAYMRVMLGEIALE